MKIGKPIEPMLVAESGANDSKYVDIIKKHKGQTFAQIKYDGYRIQVHKNKNKEISMFTSGLNRFDNSVFPDIMNQLSKLPTGIFDGEIVGLEPGLPGYNAIKNRVQGTLDSELVKTYPLQVRFFDVIQLESKEILGFPLKERRKTLENYVDNVAEQFVFGDADDLKGKFVSVTDEHGFEGLVCKNPGSLYVPGSRTQNWIKLKKFITLDLVVLGIYPGEGKAANLPFAAIMAGTRNEDKYETIVKLGMSNKVMIDRLYGLIKNGLQETVPVNVVLSPELKRKTYARKIPQMYVDPSKSAVVEVKALNISRSENWSSCGLADGEAYSLRIASVERIRDDKTPSKATTTQQIAELYSP